MYQAATAPVVSVLCVSCRMCCVFHAECVVCFMQNVLCVSGSESSSEEETSEEEAEEQEAAPEEDNKKHLGRWSLHYVYYFTLVCHKLFRVIF